MPNSLFPRADAATRARLDQDEIVRRANGFDWSKTELGLIPTWPEALRAAVRMMLVSEVPMVMMAGRRDGVLIYNEGYAVFAGDRHPELFGRPVLEAWPEIAAFNAENMRRGFNGESWYLPDQKLLLNRTGQLEPAWMNLNYSPVLDDAGVPLAVLVIVVETTQRVRAAEEREMVAQELSHRIKNIFAVITGLVGLMARARPEIAGLAEDLRARIHALGRTHDFIRPPVHPAAASVSKASLHALIRDLLAPYTLAGGGHVDITGPDLGIEDGAATPLALLFHELATNSAKYGALLQPGGTVAISAATEGDDVLLRWEEGGVELPAGEHREGFGSRLIALSVERQMRGKVTRDWRPDGLRVEVRLPLAALNQPGALQARPS